MPVHWTIFRSFISSIRTVIIWCIILFFCKWTFSGTWCLRQRTVWGTNALRYFIGPVCCCISWRSLRQRSPRSPTLWRWCMSGGSWRVYCGSGGYRIGRSVADMRRSRSSWCAISWIYRVCRVVITHDWTSSVYWFRIGVVVDSSTVLVVRKGVENIFVEKSQIWQNNVCIRFKT